MILFIIYLTGSLIAGVFPKEIVRLAYKTMNVDFVDDGKSFFNNDGGDDFPNWMYIIFTVGLSWISVIAIYVTTIIYIFLNKKIR